MISALLSRVVILLLGTLYPAYSSYKAIRTKDVSEYVKWMMYWVVFAIFVSAETITDVFFSFWFPFYYEIKIVVVLWLLSPATQGSSVLYRQFVHPVLVKREKEIDEYLVKAKEESYKTVVELGTKGVQYASRVIMQTAINGGGGLMNTLRKSYSVGDVSDGQAVNSRRTGVVLQALDEVEGPRHRQQAIPPASLQDVSDSEFEEIEEIEEHDGAAGLMGPPTQRAPSRLRTTREVFFTEIDNSRRRGVVSEAERYIGEIRSAEDISSGYSSTEQLHVEAMDADDTAVNRRTGSSRTRGTRSSANRPVSTVMDGARSNGSCSSKNLNSEIAHDGKSVTIRAVKRRAPPPPTQGEGVCLRNSSSRYQEEDNQDVHDLKQALNALKRVPRS